MKHSSSKTRKISLFFSAVGPLLAAVVLSSPTAHGGKEGRNGANTFYTRMMEAAARALTLIHSTEPQSLQGVQGSSPELVRAYAEYRRPMTLLLEGLQRQPIEYPDGTEPAQSLLADAPRIQPLDNELLALIDGRRYLQASRSITKLQAIQISSLYFQTFKVGPEEAFKVLIREIGAMAGIGSLNLRSELAEILGAQVFPQKPTPLLRKFAITGAGAESCEALEPILREVRGLEHPDSRIRLDCRSGAPKAIALIPQGLIKTDSVTSLTFYSTLAFDSSNDCSRALILLKTANLIPLDRSGVLNWRCESTDFERFLLRSEVKVYR